MHLADFRLEGFDDRRIFDEEVDVLPLALVEVVGRDADVSPAILTLHFQDLELTLGTHT